jgi:hypothetical protein
MLAHEVDDRYACPARIVQICQAVSETGHDMQQGACRFFSHARIAIGRSGDNTFEQPEYASYFECGDNMNF